MRNIKKFSIISAVGGSLFVADNVFNIGDNNVNALTQDAADSFNARRRAAALSAIVNLLLLDEDELAVDDSYTAQQNTPFTISGSTGVLANDNAPVGSTLMLLQDVSNGSLTLNPDGSFAYLPNIDFTGFDSFTYSLMTVDGVSDEATVSIRVNGTPEAVDDSFLLTANAQFSSNVIINIVGGSDTILDGAQVVEVSNEPTALGGTVSIQANGDFQYTPPVSLGSQQDSFVYTLQDSDGETDTATITWQIGVDFGGLDTPFSVAENQVLDSQITITAPTALQSLEVNGTTFSLAQLNGSGVATPLSISGEQFGEFTITGFNELTGVMNFRFDPTGITQDHSAAINNALAETIAIRAIDSGIATPFDAQLRIDVLDTAPIANNDRRSISEGTSAIAGNTVGVSSAATGDVQDVVVDPVTVTDLDTGAVDGVVGTNLSGEFGAMVINSAGIYTYTLDNTSDAVQGLKSGESVTDVFTYTLTDNEAPQADSDTATITVTIDGVDDPLPTVTIADLNAAAAGQQSVTEGSSDIVNGTVTISASAGIQSLTVSGQEVSNASTAAVTITGADGSLVASGFNSNTGVLSYSYTEDGAADDHSAGAVTDQFTIVATDNEDDSTTGTLSITIDDTEPVAVADSNTVAEDAASPVVSGDLLANDTSGADTPLVVNGISAGTSEQTPGQYGTLLVTSGGGYTYTLTNNATAVQALRSNQQLTDSFSYTLVDTEGDSSSSTLMITITGQDEPPRINIADNNGAAVGDESIAENAVLSSRTFSINAEAGLASMGTALQMTNEQANSLNLTLAQLQSLSAANVSLVGTDGSLTLNGFVDNGDDVTIAYTFDPTASNRDHSGGDESVVDMFSIIATDDLSRSTLPSVLDILIADTAPTAAPDTASVTEDAVPNVVTGDVITNDTQGADTSISVVGVDFDGAQTVGTPFSSDYGLLDLNSDGTYTYTLDNGNNSVQNLNAGQSLTETFSYSVADTDGDTSSTTFVVTINGADEPPSITVPDTNGAGTLGDVSVREDLTSGGSFTITSTAGLATAGTALQIGDEQNDALNLTLAQLQNLNAAPQNLAGTDGTLTLNSYATSSDDHIIGFSFDPTGSSKDHSGGDIVEMYSIIATDTSSLSNVAQGLDILITDTSPVANNDARSITEGTSAIAGNTVGTSSAASGDVQDSLTDANANPVIDVDFGGTDGTVGSNLAGDFGTFIISSAGVYTYTLDNTSTDVQGLKSGESITDVFTYTIQDGDGSTDSANFTVTINGVEDPLPTVTLADANASAAGQQTVIDGSGDSVNGTATITASAGIKNLTVAGQSVINASSSAVSITGNDGLLVVTGFNSATGLLNYSYTENGTTDGHSAGAISDQFTIVATDNEDDTGNNTLSISIDDTGATVSADTGSASDLAMSDVITGNVFDSDGSRGSKTLTRFQFSGGSQATGSLVNITYGETTLSASGAYTFTFDNSDIDRLNASDSV